MRLGPCLLLPLVGLLSMALAAPAYAAEPVPTTLTMDGKAQHAGESTPLRIDLTQEDGTPVAGAQVLVERRVSGAWTQITAVTTDEAGHAELAVEMSPERADNLFRASYAGDASYAPSSSGHVRVPLLRRNSRVVVRGPDEVVDETSVPVRVRWRTGEGDPVRGTVRLLRKIGDRRWKVYRKLETGADGRAKVTVRPRVDTRWRATVRRLDWIKGDRSRVHRLDNLPPGRPVKLPRAAPRPRVNLPDQAHAVGEGPNSVVRRIPNRVWKQMTGRSWHQGCPVGRGRLRYLRINYWDYRGYRRRGELVAHADAVRQMAGALSEMYRRNLPIRAMYRVDRFGWSKRLRGADDYRSMAAGNTSAFNCRGVVGNPSVRSPHSWGRSLDLNTWENPYRSAQGTVPNTWWQGRAHPRVAWRSRSHPVVAIMRRHGMAWTYGTGDTQHFDATGRHGRVRTYSRECLEIICK